MIEVRMPVISLEKLALALGFFAVLAVVFAITWVNIDEQHQLTTRTCVQRYKPELCVQFTEVP